MKNEINSEVSMDYKDLNIITKANLHKLELRPIIRGEEIYLDGLKIKGVFAYKLTRNSNKSKYKKLTLKLLVTM